MAFIDKLNDLLDKASSDFKEMFIFGDFNIDILNVNTSNNLLNCFNLHQLSQLIQDPTRVTLYTRSAIDLFFTSQPELITESGVLPIVISDHYLIYGVHKWDQPKQKGDFINFRSFENINHGAFNDDLSTAPWHHVFDCENVNDAWYLWYSMLMKIFNLHAPEKTKRVRNASLPWLSTEIVHLMRQRDRIHKMAVRSGSPDDWDTYKKLRNMVTSKIRSEKSNYYVSAIESNKGNSSTFWRTIKGILPSKQKPTPNCVVMDSEHLESPIDIANAFNEHFSTIAERMASSPTQTSMCNTAAYDGSENHVPVTDHCTEQKLVLSEITEAFVQKQIDSMPVGKATGIDGLSVKLLKLACPHVITTLTYILNLSIRSGQYPNAWKYASVIPIYKGGDKGCMNNYRPISILPIVSKILERAVHNDLYSYLDKNSMIPPCQSGFRPMHSTETTLHGLINNCLYAVEHGQITGTVFIDLSKAFDSVNHNILLEKLHAMNLSASVVTWFESYLGGRKQSVCIKKRCSEALPFITGVPQGSILGPLLFMIYTSDISRCIPKNCQLFMYADDSTITCSSSNRDEIERSLNTAMTNIYNWAAHNRLKINATKTKSMVIGSKHKVASAHLNIIINNNPVEQVTSYKCLGVIIDDSLTWSLHVDHIKNKVSSKLAMLSRIRHSIPKSSLHTLVKTFVVPSLEYCCTVWGGRLGAHSNLLNMLLKRAARLILGCPYRTASTDMFSELNWLSFVDRIRFKKNILVYKCLHHQCPEYMTDLFVHFKNSCTRQNDNRTLRVPIAKKECLRSSFAVSGAKLWNDLPISLRKIESLSVFKTQLFKFLIA